MLEALTKAGLVTETKAREADKVLQKERANNEKSQRHQEKTDRQKKHEAWAATCYKNRFDQVATFEIWKQQREFPKNYLDRCALCGKDLIYAEDAVLWSYHKDKTAYHVCEKCAENE
jgi:hypothetical protein